MIFLVYLALSIIEFYDAHLCVQGDNTCANIDNLSRRLFGLWFAMIYFYTFMTSL